MTETTRKFAKAAMIIVAVAAWTGLATQFYVTQTHPNLQSISPLARTVRFLEYFTILTNLLVALSLTISLLFPSTSLGRFFSTTGVRTSIAVYIALVGIVYNIVLQGLHDFSGLSWWADFITHDVVPIVYTIYWFVFVRDPGLSWKSAFTWTIYPLVYVSYALVSGSYTGRYPYPFLDVSANGLPAVLLNTLVLSLVFLILGEIFVAVAKFTTGPSPRNVESEI